jgi:sRNA-binding regulator protein Hfq
MDHNHSTFAGYIDDLMAHCHDMSIYLVNGIRLDGKIIGYDSISKCIWISNIINFNKPQVVFLSAVSTISFAKMQPNITAKTQHINNTL